MKKNKVLDYLLYCGIGNENFESIRGLLWRRNLRATKITAIMAGAIGALFLLLNVIRGVDVWFPYVVLMAGSLIILVLLKLLMKSHSKGVMRHMILCYAQMILVCVYAGILSTQKNNYDIPATSVIVFIALLPLAIDDRPLRMYTVMSLETGAYLAVSYFFKSPEAFSLDLINGITFALVGMVLYGVICNRNVGEIYQSVRVEKIQKSIISSLAEVVEERDENTGNHIARTEAYVTRLLRRMKKEQRYSYLTKEYCDNLILASSMHDIGKIKIPDAILNKPGKLTEDEYEIMKKHASFGGDIIQKTIRNVEEEEYCDIAYNIARYHHERYDGTGYPDGLKGNEIPLEARIMALADVYDALISERVYKKAFPEDQAREIIREGAGTQFDPDLAVLFLECLQK